MNLAGEQSKINIFEKPHILIIVKYCTIFDRTDYIVHFDSINTSANIVINIINKFNMKKKNPYQKMLTFAVLLVFTSIISVSNYAQVVPAKKFFAVTIDNNNNKWFLTDQGLVSFNGAQWTHHKDKMQGMEMRDIFFDSGTEGTGFWIATGSGITSLRAPLEPGSSSSSYDTDNASLLSNNVLKVVTGKNKITWIGTEKGVSAFTGSKWLDVDYDEFYPSVIFQEYPITAMATNQAGDSLYVATKGAGIARVFRNEVDGISGASVYAQWGPIILPSDNVTSVFIEKNGKKWFGTDMGVAYHIGDETLENWEVYTTDDGLVNDYVQSITADQKGNLWFGTTEGISVFNGTAFTNYTIDNGLSSNNILCLTIDKEGVIWIGTDNGVNSFSSGAFKSYK